MRPKSREPAIAKQRGFLLNPFRFGGASGPNDIVSADVIALLRMNDTSGGGTTFTDDGPNGFTVTASGSAVQVTDGAALGGASMSLGANTTDYITVSASASLKPTANFSLIVRARIDAVLTGASILSLVDWGDAFAGIASLRAYTGSTNSLDYYYSNTNLVNIAASWVANTFHEVALCYDSTGPNAYLFFDGTLIDSRAITIALPATPALRVGNVNAGGATNNKARSFEELLLMNTCLYTANYTPHTGPYVLV